MQHIVRRLPTLKVCRARATGRQGRIRPRQLSFFKVQRPRAAGPQGRMHPRLYTCPGGPPTSGRRAEYIPDGVPALEVDRPRAVGNPGFNGPAAIYLPRRPIDLGLRGYQEYIFPRPYTKRGTPPTWTRKAARLHIAPAAYLCWKSTGPGSPGKRV